MRHDGSDPSLNRIPFMSLPLSLRTHTLQPKHTEASHTHKLTAVAACARPPGGTVALVGCHATASVQARQDADSCHQREECKREAGQSTSLFAGIIQPSDSVFKVKNLLRFHYDNPAVQREICRLQGFWGKFV